MLDKIWFIKVDERKEGPYNIQDLKHHPRMTPDTLVWKEGFKDWILARFVPELKVLFEDEKQGEELHDRFRAQKVILEDSTLALEGSNFPFLFYWLIILLIVFAYLFFKLNS